MVSCFASFFVFDFFLVSVHFIRLMSSCYDGFSGFAGFEEIDGLKLLVNLVCGCMFF